MKVQEKTKAQFLRKKGYSINEISNILKISKSTASVWVESIVLGNEARNRIQRTILQGQLRSKKTIFAKSKLKFEKINTIAKSVIKGCRLNRSSSQVLCSLIYLCEGAKSPRSMNFTNSDPQLIHTFLRLLRKNFSVEESKFRVSMHLHEYHNENKQLQFWSKMTRIPQRQFNQSYLKPSTGIYKKEGYQGCVSVRYHDTVLASSLLTIAKKFMNSMGL